ncbi:MAG: DUF1846 domain-containing protein [Bacilli bacterium]
MEIGFDNEKYIMMQSDHIKKRIESIDGKLYMEFGGKLFDDFHASRVLPGFLNDSKIKMLEKMKNDTEIIFCIYAGDIEKNKIRADLGITYDLDILRLIDNISKLGILINSIVITRYTGQPSVDIFIKKMKKRGVKTYIHSPIKGYPADIEKIASEDGYGKNPYIETTKSLVVVTGPGPGSGKLATCLNQLYHENRMNNKAGYAKFETFPIWNLSLNHPVNLAYEAATADLDDVNMIDSFHLDAYGETTINYNRDIEAFPVVNKLLLKLTGKEIYKSPTDMGVNMVGKAITNDEVVCYAACQEIIRRYFKAKCDVKKGILDDNAVDKIKYLLERLNLTELDRKVVPFARKKLESSKASSVSIELNDGIVVTGKTTELMTGGAAAIVNAIKYLSGLSGEILLLPSSVLKPIIKLKEEERGISNSCLTVQEVLIAISVSTSINSAASVALKKLKELKNVEAHSTHIFSFTDEQTYRELGINLTCDDEYPTTDLYFK